MRKTDTQRCKSSSHLLVLAESLPTPIGVDTCYEPLVEVTAESADLAQGMLGGRNSQ